MQLQNIDHNSLQLILTRLDQALYNHQQWHNDLMRTLACRLPCDKHDIIPDAHKECRFGQWYYSNQDQGLSDHPGFIAIGDAHLRLHQMVSHLLTNLNSTSILTPLEYDNFANALERLRLEIYGFKGEIEVLLYNRDPLTMATNRISMLPILREQQELSKRQFQPCCIAMVDLDLFKKVNDEHGHIAGDKVLAEVSRFLINHLRPYDKIFRFGGEEFLLYFQQVSLIQAAEMVDRLRSAIAEFPFDIGLPQPIHITVSCGVTELSPNLTIEESIDHSDKALYLAKSAGRNRTQIWNAEMAS